MNDEFMDELIARIGQSGVQREKVFEMPVELPDGRVLKTVKIVRIERKEDGSTTEFSQRNCVRLDCGHFATTQEELARVEICLCGGLVCGNCLGANASQLNSMPDETQIRRCRHCGVAVCRRCGTKTPEGFFCLEHISRFGAKRVFLAPFEILAFILSMFRKQEPTDGDPQQ